MEPLAREILLHFSISFYKKDGFAYGNVLAGDHYLWIKYGPFKLIDAEYQTRVCMHSRRSGMSGDMEIPMSNRWDTYPHYHIVGIDLWLDPTDELDPWSVP